MLVPRACYDQLTVYEASARDVLGVLDQVSQNGRVMRVGLSVPELSGAVSSRAEQYLPTGMVVDCPY